MQGAPIQQLSKSRDLHVGSAGNDGPSSGVQFGQSRHFLKGDVMDQSEAQKLNRGCQNNLILTNPKSYKRIFTLDR